MLIVFEVARDAVHVHVVGEWIGAVAIIANEFTVQSGQRELCIAIMIERRIRPRLRAMTIFAFLAAPAIVYIVFRMAAEAGGWRALEGRVLMAVSACNVHVLADQAVVGGLVIEHDVNPGCG